MIEEALLWVGGALVGIARVVGEGRVVAVEGTVVRWDNVSAAVEVGARAGEFPPAVHATASTPTITMSIHILLIRHSLSKEYEANCNCKR